MHVKNDDNLRNHCFVRVQCCLSHCKGQNLFELYLTFSVVVIKVLMGCWVLPTKGVRILAKCFNVISNWVNTADDWSEWCTILVYLASEYHRCITKRISDFCVDIWQGHHSLVGWASSPTSLVCLDLLYYWCPYFSRWRLLFYACCFDVEFSVSAIPCS